MQIMTEKRQQTSLKYELVVVVDADVVVDESEVDCAVVNT